MDSGHALPLFSVILGKASRLLMPSLYRKKLNKVVCAFSPYSKVNVYELWELERAYKSPGTVIFLHHPWWEKLQWTFRFIVLKKKKKKRKKGVFSLLFEKHQDLLCSLIVAWVEFSILAQSSSTWFCIISSLYTPNLTRGTGRVRQCVGRLEKIRKV